MTDLVTLIQGDSSIWLGALPPYQRNTIDLLLQNGVSLEDVAVSWFSASYDNTAPFGVRDGSKIYHEKFLDEIHDFLCSSEKYAADREKLAGELGIGQASAVGMITATLAPHLNAAPTFLAPAVAVTMCLVAKMGLRAWCSVQSERRSKSQNSGIGSPSDNPPPDAISPAS